MGEPETTGRQDLRAWQVRTFALLWTGYASYYLCRMNFSVAKPAISREFSQWSDTKVGIIISAYQVLYAVGQFVNGQLAERLGARLMMTLALLLASFANLMLAWSSTLEDPWPGMVFAWAINGIAQSAGWPLVVKTMSDWVTSKRRGTVIGLISTCYQVGNVAAWLLAGWLAQEYGWRMAFVAPALFLIPMAITLGSLLRNRPEDAGFPPVRDDLSGLASGPLQRLKASEVLRQTLTNRVLWVLALGYFCMNAVRYAFMNWAPDYMATFHGLAIRDSAFTAVALPLIGAVGAVLAGSISDTLFGRRRAPVCALMLFGLAVVCVVFVYVPQGSVLAATALLGLAGFLIYGPDMLMSGAATVDVHPSAAAAATGFTMCAGATGAIFSGVGVGWLKDAAHGQWTAVFFTLAGLAVLSALLMVFIWNARPKGD